MGVGWGAVDRVEVGAADSIGLDDGHRVGELSDGRWCFGVC
jgi:hypothetical protein